MTAASARCRSVRERGGRAGRGPTRWNVGGPPAEERTVTVRQIERSSEFHLIFYLPAQQRTYSINLNRNIVRYLLPQHRATLFPDRSPCSPRSDEETLKALFETCGEGGRGVQT